MFSEEDRNRVKPQLVLEQGIKPNTGSETIYIPFDWAEINQFPTLTPYDKIVYVGNDYRRREDIEEKLIPFSIKYPKIIKFYGNWLKDSQKDIREKWNNIEFNSRVGFNSFREIYSHALFSPLLSPPDYKERGHMTARIIEILFWGSIPVGFSDFYGIEKWLPSQLIVNKDNTLENVYLNLKKMGFFDRINLRNQLINRLKFHDVENFINKIIK